MPIKPTLITGLEIAKDTITPQFNENSFRQENLFAPPTFPFKIPPSPEPNIQIQTLPVKTMAEAFGNAKKNDRPAVIYDGDILDRIVSKSWNYDEAIAILNCESSGRKEVISPTGDVGLYQINLSAHWDEIQGETREEKIEWLQNPLNNIEFAYGLYQESFWQPWVCAKILNII